MDAQHKWEMIALNAIEQAATSNWMLAQAAHEAEAAGDVIDPKKIADFARETQLRLARDIRQLREITQQREEEQP
jgi:hypothetical protein